MRRFIDKLIALDCQDLGESLHLFNIEARSIIYCVRPSVGRYPWHVMLYLVDETLYRLPFKY